MSRPTLALGVLFSLSVFAHARDSRYTTGGHPLYWTTYEYNYSHEDYIPEDVFRKNVDWVAAELKPYGYSMIVTDGWIYTDVAVNADGYIAKYHNRWEHDLKYWNDYCEAKGLKLGLYFNPLWILDSAYQQNTRIAGTNATIQSIAGERRNKKVAIYSKYWVDPTKPGAKEYVQDYVRYIKSLGIRFLRLDFLTEFEEHYGSEAYDRALGWIAEAGGDDLMISIVMPNCYENSRAELAHGDMLRTSEDTFKGAWQIFSVKTRGTIGPKWPITRNAFDGLVHFSPVCGRGLMVPDGDAIRLNTFANDTERRTAMTLYTIAGSCIPVGDQWDTIGTLAPFYENRELIALTQAGFVGKPFSADIKNPDSQRWVGQDGEGNWIVAIFNREGKPERRRIDYAADLGLVGAAPTRDLWAHENLGVKTELDVELAPHDSRIVKIAAPVRRFEAEVATVRGGASAKRDLSGHSGFGYVELGTAADASVEFFVDAASAQKTKLVVRCGSVSGEASAALCVNGQRIAPIRTRGASAGEWDSVEATVALQAGANRILVRREPNDAGSLAVDYVEVR